MKRSQTTIFVILGIVIIILAGLAIFITQRIKPTNQPINVDKELQPLKQAIEECMLLSGKDAMVKAGLQGGWVMTGRLRPDLVSPTKGNAFYLSPPTVNDPKRTIIIPYWSDFLGEACQDKTACQDSQHLPLKRKAVGDFSVESQVDAYLFDDTGSCILEVQKTFTDKGYTITPTGKPVFTTLIADNDVTFDLTYPLTIVLNGKTYKMDRYRTTLDLPFKKYYEAAEKILYTVSPSDAQYFEKLTIESFSPFALSKDSELPPLAGTTENGGAMNMWTQTDVQKKIQTIMTENIGNVQVLGSRDVQLPVVLDSQYKKVMYDNYQVALPPDDNGNTIDVSPYMIRFLYLPWWNMYVKVRPSRGQIIRPEKFKTSFPIPMEFQKYNFQYDIAYPVLIQLRDPDALLGEGFTFQFGYEVNIRSSEPFTADVQEIQVPQEDTFQFCDEKNRKSGSVQIFTKDADSGDYVDGVDLTYSCVYQACELGKSVLANGKAVYTTTLPLCMDGRVNPEKDGYFGMSRILSTKKDKADSREVYIEKYKDVEVFVKKELVRPILSNEDENGNPSGRIGDNIVVTRIGWRFVPKRGSFYLDPDETAIVTFRRIPSLGEDEYSQTIMFNWTDYSKPIKLVSGSYAIEATLIRQLGAGRSVEKIIFPSKEVCGGGVLGIGEKCDTVGPIEFNETFVMGSMTFDETYPFNITKENFTGNITVFIPGLDYTKIITLDDSDAMDLTHVTADQNLPDEAWPKFGQNAPPVQGTPP